MFFRGMIRGMTLLLPAGLLLMASCGKQDNAGGPHGQRGGSDAFRQGAGMSGPAGGATGVPVQVQAVERSDISTFLLNTTTLLAEREVEVPAKVAGQVGRLFVEEGDRVKAQQVLARLDERELELQLRESEIRAKNAKAMLERTKNMFEKKLVSQENLDDVRYQYESAQAAYETARLKVEYTNIRSPIDGIVTQRLIEIGQRVNVNQPAFQVADFDPLRAVIHIPEREMHRVRVGQVAEITAEALPGKTFTGKVRMISPIVDPTSGTVKVTIDAYDRTAQLKPGMFVTTHIITETHHDALVIPKKALILESESDQVYVYDNGVARKATLQLGFKESERVEVTGGLNEGELVVVIGQEGLREGLPLRISGASAPGTSLTENAASGEARSQTQAEPSQKPAGADRTQMASDKRAGDPATGGSRAQADGHLERGRQGNQSLDPERIKRGVERLSRVSPEFKKEWEKKMKSEEFRNDLNQQREFLREWFGKMRGRRGGGGGPH